MAALNTFEQFILLEYASVTYEVYLSLVCYGADYAERNEMKMMCQKSD